MPEKVRVSNDQLIYCLKALERRLGRRPKVSDCRNDDTIPSCLTFRMRFGSWPEALRVAKIDYPSPDDGKWNYGSTWHKQRVKAMMQARGTCEHPSCDRRESQSGRALEAHHIVPYRQGVEEGYFSSREDANTTDNLLVLCREHHIELEPRSFLKR